MGILNILHPYIHLNTSYCLEDSCYIAGVINPMFKSGKKFEENYDVIVPLDRKS